MFVSLSFISYGQEALNKIQYNTSPASSIIGLQPSVVLTPKTHQALETALFSNFLNGNNLVVPNDFALEFTPYWTKNRSLSLEEYLYPKSYLEQFKRGLSFSIASSQNYLLGDSSASNAMAIGGRTTLYFRQKHHRDSLNLQLVKLRSNMKTNIAAQSALDEFYLEMSTLQETPGVSQDSLTFVFYTALQGKFKDILFSTGAFSTKEETEQAVVKIMHHLPLIDWQNTDAFSDSVSNLLDNILAYNQVAGNLKKLVKKREESSIDLAYASLINFPQSNFSAIYLSKQTAWITIHQKWLYTNERTLHVSGVLRREWYNDAFYPRFYPNLTIYQNNTDLGLSVKGIWDRFSLSIEAVYRSSNSEIPAGTDAFGNELFRKEKQNDRQVLGSIQYTLRDNVVLSYSLGERFDPILNPGNTLVSLLSLNFGFGGPTTDNVDLTR